jgi:hypothetical protein
VPLQLNALTTLAIVLDELGIAGDGGAQDTRLVRYINAASDFAAGYCGRTFHRAEVVETAAPRGGVYLLLARTPIVSIVSIFDGGVELDAGSYEIRDAFAGIVHRSSGWRWPAARRATITYPAVPGTEDASIEATYVGGYATPAQVAEGGAYAGEAVTVPSDLEDAVVQLVVSRWKGRTRDRRIASESYSHAAFTYLGEPVPPEVRATLDRYARPASS